MFIAQYLAQLRDAYFRTAPVQAQANSTTISQGGSAQIPIDIKNIQDVNGLGGYDIKITFNPSIIRVDSVTGGTAPFSGVTSSIDNNNGNVLLNYQQGSMPGPTGNITVAFLNVTGLATGQSPLDVTINSISSARGDNIIPSQDIDGTVTVN